MAASSALASNDSIRDRDALRRFLDGMEQVDAEQQVTLDPSALKAAIEKLKQYLEPEVGLIRISGGISPAYNMRTAVDGEHALIVTRQHSIQPASVACCRWQRQLDKRWASRRS